MRELFRFFLAALLLFSLSWSGWSQSGKNKTSAKKTPSTESITLKDGTVVQGLTLGKNRSGHYYILVQKSWVKKNLPEKAETLFKDEATRVEKSVARIESLIDEWIDEAKKGGKPTRLLDALQDEKARLREKNADQNQFIFLDVSPKDLKKKSAITPVARHLLLVAWQERLPDVETRAAEDLAAEFKEAKIDWSKEKIRMQDRLPSLPVESSQDWLTRKALFSQAREAGLHLQGSGDFLVEAGKKTEINFTELFQGVGKSVLGDVFKELGIGGAQKQNPSWEQNAAKLAADAKAYGVRVTRMTPDLQGGKVSLDDHFFVRLPNNVLVPVWSGQLAAGLNVARPKLEAQIRSDPNVAAMIKQIEGLGGLGQQIGPQLALAIRGGAATMELYDFADTAFQELLKQTGSRLDGMPLYWFLK